MGSAKKSFLASTTTRRMPRSSIRVLALFEGNMESLHKLKYGPLRPSDSLKVFSTVTALRARHTMAWQNIQKTTEITSHPDGNLKILKMVNQCAQPRNAIQCCRIGR